MQKNISKNPHEGHRLKMKNRFLKEGMDHFEEHNVLELILYFAIPRKDTNEIAHALLNRFGSLSKVMEADMEALCSVEGIGEHAAMLLKTYPAVAKRYYRSRFRSGKKLLSYQDMGQDLVLHFAGQDNEQVLAVFYDNSMCFVGRSVIHTGNVNSVSFSLRTLCDAAVQHKASYAVLAHNHPGGRPIASSEDLDTTARIARFLGEMNVTLVDHFIVAEGHYSSTSRDNYYRFYQTYVLKDLPLRESEFEK